MTANLKTGLAVLEAALVTPLCLNIRNDGSWGFYKTIALGGHPSPGNAKKGFSHPVRIQAFRESDSRTLGNLSALPTDPDAATAYGERIARELWPEEWTVWVTTKDAIGEASAIDICRRCKRDTSAAYLVQLRIQNIHPESIQKLMQGGRP
jgi:hypothetical protein